MRLFQSVFLQLLEDENEDFVEHLLGKSLANNGHGRMDGSGFGYRQSEKLAERTAIVTTPSNAPLTVQPFKIPDQDHPKVDSGRDTGTSFLCVVGFTELLNKVIEPALIENLIQFVVEGVSLCANNLTGCNKQLLFFRFPLAECYVGIIRSPIRQYYYFGLQLESFLTG